MQMVLLYGDIVGHKINGKEFHLRIERTHCGDGIRASGLLLNIRKNISRIITKLQHSTHRTS